MFEVGPTRFNTRNNFFGCLKKLICMFSKSFLITSVQYWFGRCCWQIFCLACSLSILKRIIIIIIIIMIIIIIIIKYIYHFFSLICIFFRWWLDVGFFRFSLQHIDGGYQILKNIILFRAVFKISRMKFYIGVFRANIIQASSLCRRYPRLGRMDSSDDRLGEHVCSVPARLVPVTIICRFSLE